MVTVFDQIAPPQGESASAEGYPAEPPADVAQAEPPAEEQRQEAAHQESSFEKLLRWADPKLGINIAAELDQTKLGPIGSRVTQGYQIDDQSRSGWKDKSKAAVKLAMQVAEEKTFPWPKSANVIYPLMTKAAIEFGARAYPAIVSGPNVVKGTVVGKDDGTPVLHPVDGTPMVQVQQGPDGQPVTTPVWKVAPGEKRRRADRIGEHMSWQLLSEQKEWEQETDRLLHILPILGCMFRKAYFDPEHGCNAARLVSSMNVVINYWAPSIERAPRATEEIKLYPYEIEAKKRKGIFLDQDYSSGGTTAGDDQAPVEFLEQHCLEDLDEDGYPEPYVVTVHRDTGRVARIVARYDAEGIEFDEGENRVVRIEPVHYYEQYDFLPNQEGGVYGMGFGQLLIPLNEAANTALNMMLDAGQAQTAGGGFIGKGLSMHAGQVKWKPGEFKVVNALGSKIREAIVPIEHAGPSAVLFSLLGLLIEAGKDVASVKDILTGDAGTAQMQPTTLLAMIEQGLKVFTAIYKRIHRAAKGEYQKLYRLNRIYLEEQTQYRHGDEWRDITRADYELGSGVEPVSDPNMVSDMQRLTRAQFLLGFAENPRFDGDEIYRRAFEAAKIENIDTLFAKGQSGPSSDMIIAAAMVEQGSIKTRAAAIKDLSAAVLNLANADKAVGDAALAYIGQQFEILKAQMERLDAQSAQPAEPPTL